ncbi:MAG: hypothetical protein E6R13_02810 [Spirochaetes bacterium]|nr:MAG: hypothetical protein E6R13_02810 [Spirochaetota bacterium]
MANLDFRTDLKLGNEGEDAIIKFLESKGHKYLDSNYDNQYDIKMLTNGKETTYEVKTDVKCAPLFDTGNLFIEFESRSKASGIAVTKAKWFVTYFKYLNELWFIKSEDLRKLIQDNNFPIFKDAGDIGSATHGYLIKRKTFKKYFHVCKI